MLVFFSSAMQSCFLFNDISNYPMHKLSYIDDHYRTENRSLQLISRLLPSIVFYFRLICIVFRASRLAKNSNYDGTSWAESSYEVMQRLEDVGVCIEISGIENIAQQEGSVVIVGNHMSMMETLLLPVMIQPLKPVTYVVKEALLDYPVFKYVLRARNPIAVTRANPRQDLKTVLTDGLEKLKNNISIIVFPQTTRSHTFDAKKMSSIGVKLAKKANVPIIPLALKTDCWQNGRKLKDFGKLDITKTAYFAFGKPIAIEGKGAVEQEAVNAFISGKLKEWEGKV